MRHSASEGGWALAVALCGLIAATGHAQAPVPDSPAIEHHIDSLLSKLTLEEKIDLLGGTDGMYTHAVPSIDWPSFKMSDGPVGVETWGPSTAYAAGIGLAASWDTALAYDIGKAIGRDARARGVHILLGPGLNIYRAPMNGRNFEYLGEDPFLAGRTAVGYIRGVQSQGVSATAKHFMANNEEYDRHRVSSDMDERAMREIYLPAFEAAVKDGHVGAIMDAYNLVNGVHATQNALINDTIAKREWGFDGLIMSDWRSTYDGVKAANAGLDLEMPSALFMNRDTLLPAIRAGTVSTATIDDKVRRLMRLAMRFGFLGRPKADASISLNDVSSRAVALRSALEGTVLLKNLRGTLPLDARRIHTIAVIGPNAWPSPTSGGGSANMESFQSVSLLSGIEDYLMAHHATGTPMPNVLYNPGLPLPEDVFESSAFRVDTGDHAAPGLRQELFDHGFPIGNGDVPASAIGTPASSSTISMLAPERAVALSGDREHGHGARWSGVFTPPKAGEYLLLVEDEDLYQLTVDDSVVLDQRDRQGEQTIRWVVVRLMAGRATRIALTLSSRTAVVRPGLGIRAVDDLVTPEAREMAKAADAVIVAVGYDQHIEEEGTDRPFELPWGQSALIRAVAAANPRTIVTVTSGGSVAMNDWLDQVPAVMFNWYPGQEGGTALAELLFGAANPEGRLPATFERRWEDNPTHDSYYPTSAAGTSEPHIRYAEGVFVGYRGYSADKLPLFPFGFGLSYTTFTFSHLAVTPRSTKLDAPVRVAFDITNTGDRAGAEVAQVYVGDPSAQVKRPLKELKGFAKVKLKPGETQHVVVTLDRRSFAYWDSTSHGWHVDPGTFTIYVGRSSADTPLKADLTIGG